MEAWIVLYIALIVTTAFGNTKRVLIIITTFIHNLTKRWYFFLWICTSRVFRQTEFELTEFTFLKEINSITNKIYLAENCNISKILHAANNKFSRNQFRFSRYGKLFHLN